MKLLLKQLNLKQKRKKKITSDKKALRKIWGLFNLIDVLVCIIKICNLYISFNPIKSVLSAFYYFNSYKIKSSLILLNLCYLRSIFFNHGLQIRDNQVVIANIYNLYISFNHIKSEFYFFLNHGLQIHDNEVFLHK